MTDVKTKAQAQIPALVVLGLPDGMVVKIRRVARLAAPCRVESTTIDNVATKVARLRPFAIVVPDDVFNFDPGEFRALAKDVGARVLKLSHEDIPEDFLVKHLVPLLAEAFVDHDG